MVLDTELGQQTMHCSHQPALGNRHYYLFGVCVSQHAWFDILEYTEEEQVVHCLRWGRND